MTTFKHTLALCGLSHTEAADYLTAECGNVSLQTVKDMARGKSFAGDDVTDAMARLWRRIEDVAEANVDLICAMLDDSDRRAFMNISADDSHDPLPGGASEAAGALALLYAMGISEADAGAD